MESNIVLECLRTRRSIRKYSPQQITDEELTAVLEAGTYAPTGKGLQDPWIVAVQKREQIETLVRMNATVMGVESNPYYDAPTIVLVFASSPDKWANGILDGTLVLGNMMTAAHALGLGACWINREREMFATEEGRALMKQWGLPDGLVGVGALSLGYPAGTPKPQPARKENYFRIIR
ncbi:MAG: nitroreductase [Bacteroidales bacterium]|nr:nitroreductase [Bacteroidales bacterium]